MIKALLSRRNQAIACSIARLRNRSSRPGGHGDRRQLSGGHVERVRDADWLGQRRLAAWLAVQLAARGAGLVLAPLLVVVLIMPLGDAESSAAAKASLCGKAVGPFTVHGTKVLAKNGSVFISYGMTVSGLQEGNWTGLVTEDL